MPIGEKLPTLWKQAKIENLFLWFFNNLCHISPTAGMNIKSG